MQSVPADAAVAVQSLGEALLIGVLVGVQRESTEGTHPGLRDFILIALAGGICGLLDKPWLTAAALLGIAALLALYHFETRLQRSGITTEIAGIATFCITYLAGTPAFPAAAPLAIGSAIAVVAFLEFKKRLRMFFRETITEREFNDTLAFLAVVLVIYPLLPAQRYGPYAFFSPREVWFYVILISSISYAGYFLQKFLGAERGLDVTAVLGGIASSLAATTDLARRSREEPQHSAAYARAAVLANSVQFPRTLLILYAANTAIAAACAPALLVSTVAGLALIAALSRWTARLEGRPTQTGNPFRLWPALKFGAMFAGVVLLSKAANAEAGWMALYGTSALGGVVDVGTVILSMSDLLEHSKITREAAVSYVWVALAANIMFKAGAALLSGTRAFAWRLIAALALMFGSGVAVLIFVR